MYLTVRGPLRQHGPCAGGVNLQNKLDSGSGMTRIGAVEKRVLRAVKAVSASGVQWNGTLVDVSAVSGRTVELNPG